MEIFQGPAHLQHFVISSNYHGHLLLFSVKDVLVMTMPASESSGKEGDGLSGLDSFDANNEFNRNFNQSLLGLKALNSQTGQELNFSEYLSLRMEKKDEDVVILEDPNSLSKNCNEIKNNKFTINDNIRNSIKDIMSNVKNGKLPRPQDDVNSLGNLLAQTKSLGVDSRDKPNVIKNGTTPAVSGEKGVGSNLFENFQKDIQNTTVTQETKSKEQPKEVTNGDSKGTTEVIELDDSLEDELLKSSDDSSSPKQNDDAFSNEIDKKEEEKLLQLDDVQNSKEDNTTTNDLKEENKLLELDSEDSNHSVTSVKSDTSSKSVKSDKNLHSNQSDSSEHSAKLVPSIPVEESSGNLSSQSRSQSPSTLNNKELNNHNDCSNQSTNSCYSQHSVKTNSSIKSGSNINSADSETSNHGTSENLEKNSNTSSKVENIDLTLKDSDNSNDSVKSNGSTSLCNKETESVDQKSNAHSRPDSIESKGEEDVSSSLKPNSNCENAKGNNVSKIHNEPVEVMDLDSDGESEEKASKLSTSDSKDATDIERSSVNTPSCDSEPKSVQSETSVVCDEENNDIKPEVTDRKRPADDAEVSSQPKRSRLDEVIGQLGNRTGIPLSKVKSMDELSDTDTSHLDSEMNESKSEDTSASEMDEEDEESTPTPSPRKSRRMSQKEILKLVKAQVMCYLRSYRDETIRDLHRKIHDLQGTNDMWKNKAKELERKMLELTVLQQKHEKRKAKTAALRQISTKSIAIQVDENKVEKTVTSPTSSREMMVQNQLTPNKSGTKTPPRASVGQTPPRTVVNQTPPTTTIPVITHQQILSALPSTSKVIAVSNNLTPIRSTALPSTNSPIIQQALNVPVIPFQQQIKIPIQQQPAPQTVQISSPQQQILLSPKEVYPTNKTVKSLLDSTRQQKAPANSSSVNAKLPISPPQFIMVTSTPSSVTAVKALPGAVLSSVASKAPMKIIDLTDEEDGATKMLQRVTKAAQSASMVTTVQPSQGIVRGLAPQQATLSQQNIILSSPAGTRFVNPQQQPLQLVFSGSPNIRPGNLLQVVTAPTAPGHVPMVHAPGVSQPAGIPPPQLRAALLPLTSVPRQVAPVTSGIVTVPPQHRAVRPPPPLQSAPTNQINRPLLPPTSQQVAAPKPVNHPAPLPIVDPPVIKPGEKPLAPKPTLKISRVSQGIVLSWNMTYIAKNHAEIQSYQLFAYQETTAPPLPTLWKKVGDVKALPLPMACTLTQFQEGNRYHFAVRPFDVHGRPGPFSDPSSIHLMPMK